MSKNIATLYQEHGLTAKPKTAGELCGPCPWCGGKDRFTLFTEQGAEGLGRFWCRQCGKGGDAIQFLRDLHGLSFKEARQALGLPEASFKNKSHLPQHQVCKPAFTPHKAILPSLVWQRRSTKLALWAAEQLEQSPKIQEWLEKERGLTHATARFYGLGWIPQDYFRPREAFGLPPEFKDNGKPRRVWIPKGLCIPVIGFQGHIYRVKIRVADPGPNRPKYIPIPQAEKNTSPMILESRAGHRAWQVVESELDALLLAQEAGHLVNVVAMGSASYRPDAETWAKLQAAPRVLVSLDFDEAGNKAACRWWEAHLPPGVFKLWPVPDGKDPCDSWRAGWHLADWVYGGL